MIPSSSKLSPEPGSSSRLAPLHSPIQPQYQVMETGSIVPNKVDRIADREAWRRPHPADIFRGWYVRQNPPPVHIFIMCFFLFSQVLLTQRCHPSIWNGSPPAPSCNMPPCGALGSGQTYTPLLSRTDLATTALTANRIQILSYFCVYGETASITSHSGFDYSRPETSASLSHHHHHHHHHHHRVA